MFACNYCAQAYYGQGYPSAAHWGVDSITHADDPVGGTFFDVLAQMAGRLPEFWCRYVASALRSSDNLLSV